jgi:predicted Zn-dependent protease with MMP-like domain
MNPTRQERLAGYRSIRQRYRPDRREFERLVTAALEAVPAEFRARLENIAVVVEEWPPSQKRDRPAGGAGHGQMLLGLYQGTPLGQRGTGYHLVPPDRITIFRGPILAICRSREAVIAEIRATVVHEIGHYFGLDEHELE